MTIGTIKWEVVKDFITPSWYGHLAAFVAAEPIEIIKDYPQIPLLRNGGQYLMQGFIDVGYRHNDLRILSVMRMHIRAIILADIVTADSQSITHQAWILHKEYGFRKHYNWSRSPPLFHNSNSYSGNRPYKKHLSSSTVD